MITEQTWWHGAEEIIYVYPRESAPRAQDAIIAKLMFTKQFDIFVAMQVYYSVVRRTVLFFIYLSYDVLIHLFIIYLFSVHLRITMR